MEQHVAVVMENSLKSFVRNNRGFTASVLYKRPLDEKKIISTNHIDFCSIKTSNI